MNFFKFAEKVAKGSVAISGPAALIAIGIDELREAKCDQQLAGEFKAQAAVNKQRLQVEMEALEYLRAIALVQRISARVAVESQRTS
ncbi:hypothetical protein PRK78_000681 [Emydomyces testavorans]|uniref:Uncharacterized protein n=1 Tax=Emydomyces testavorans TaxID=2070801 RepID=A0AAF0DCY3_9EURO|nr:hypothetical protein PRK78_000681 [Emydomyces testavorans]